VRIRSRKGVYSLLSDGAVLPAFGVRGGFSAVPVMTYVVRGEREMRFDTPGKVGGFPLIENDVVVMRNAGGGGYGDPLDRSLENVIEDVQLGYVDRAKAHGIYGVVFGDDLVADSPASDQLRRRMRADRPTLRAVASVDPLYSIGRASEKRICPMHPRDIDALGLRDDAIVELVGRSAAPLRAWIAASESVTEGTVPLDRIASGILQEEPGARVLIRRLFADVAA
jgi:N-methylhydantoinase B